MNDLIESIRQKNSLPALAGAIVTSNGLVAIGAAGVRKAGANVPVTIEDKWHLGSDTKAMTAVVIGSLVEQGKIKWETTLAEVYPDLARTFPPEFAKISLLHLLSHRAGLPANIDWHSPSLSGSMMEQRKKVVQIAAATKLLSAPGASFSYSNLGYVIAGAVAERVTDKPWEDLVTSIIFKPLGMNSVGFGGTGTPGKLDQPWGHGADGRPVNGNGPAMDNPPVMGPAGRVHCSLADWGKFISDQLRGQRGEHALLKTETYKRLHTPPFGGDYSSGWLITQRPWGGGTVYTHAGSNTMNFAVAWIAPERDFAVLVVSNQGGESAAKGCDDVSAALIGLYQKP